MEALHSCSRAKNWVLVKSSMWDLYDGFDKRKEATMTNFSKTNFSPLFVYLCGRLFEYFSFDYLSALSDYSYNHT